MLKRIVLALALALLPVAPQADFNTSPPLFVAHPPSGDNSYSLATTAWVNTRPAVFAYPSASQTAAANSNTTLALGLFAINNGSYFTSGANASWTPPVGQYKFSAQVTFTANIVNGGSYYCAVWKNGVVQSVHEMVLVNTKQQSCSVNEAYVYMNGTDYLQLVVYNGTGLDVTISGAYFETYFTASAL